MTNELAQAQSKKLIAYLRQHPRADGGQEAECERFLQGVHWVARSGAQGRELPGRYGHGNRVYQRDARWCEHGIWADYFAHEPDLEGLILDSSVVRAHPCAAGASKKTVGKLPKP
jgi:transposase